MIRLGQFLKVADAVDQGSDVKALLATEAVTVNGEVEVRRGRQLGPGDVVAVGATTYLLTRRQGAISADSAATGQVADDAAATGQAGEEPAQDPASGRYSSGS